jgi:ubiquinone biosynthesis protein UbiJ
VTDGYRIVYGRGKTREEAEQSAQRNWAAKFGPETESDSPAYTVATDFDEIEPLREIVDALRADNGRLLRLLLKRLSNDPRPELRQLAAIIAP